MSKPWQFRFAVHAGITVIYPAISVPESSAAGWLQGAKFAIAGRKQVRVIYPVNGVESLDPKMIQARKDKILSTLKGPEKPESNTLLNDIVQALGLSGRWDAYKHDYDESLVPFLENNGLRYHRSLLGMEPDGIIRLTYRQVADRLFATERKMPSRLFTGIGFDYWQLLELALAQPDLHVETLIDGMVTGPFDHSRPPAYYRIHSDRAAFSYAQALECFSNFLGDQLCDGGSSSQPLLPRVYQAEHAEAIHLHRGLEVFQHLLRLSEFGWVNVIPYNKNLVFLSDGMGGYDFVFRNLRDEVLPVSVTDKSDTVTEEDKDQVFRAWTYFDYSGWREQDEHKAEEDFYAKGGTRATYPGSIAVLRDYLTHRGRYPAQMLRTAIGVDLTPLVTIRAFRKYLWELGKIGKAKGIDPWLYANGEREEDDDLPVTVTWEEAADYAQWMNNKGRRQCRLPTEDEYRETFAALIPEQISAEDVKLALAEPLVEFVSYEGTLYKEHPPCMHPDDFAMMTVRYRTPVPMESGVVRSAHFGEWLEPECAAINGRFFCAQFEVAAAHEIIVSPSRARLSRDTTGKYKSMKIGFRLALLD